MGSPHDKSEHDSADVQGTPGLPPSAPKPENDTGIVPPVKSPALDDGNISPDDVDIFTLPPVSALRMLCRRIDAIVRMTGDVPPTPPVLSPVHQRRPSSSASASERKALSIRRDSMTANLVVNEHIDGVPFKRTPIGSPESHPFEPGTPATADVGYNAPPIQVQYSALARKFYSKRPPPISTEEYLLRMHKYCPMSTAVYVAASLYISRLAVIDRILPVTPRNVHRLLLAGLRVAMKALEDLSWPHSRFSKVGGVSELELGRLEVTFCFLMDFTLKVDEKMLQSEAENLCRAALRDSFGHHDGSAVIDAVASAEGDAKTMQLKIPEARFKPVAQLPNTGIHTPSRTPEKRKASSTLPSRPAFSVGSGGIEVVGQS